MKSYKGYIIVKVTSKDWIIQKDGKNATMNGKWIKGSDGKYERNAMTLKEAKARIDANENN
jgi:hypothetical protein